MWSKSAFYDFYVFFKDIKSQFSKANLGYFDTFFEGFSEINICSRVHTMGSFGQKYLLNVEVHGKVFNPTDI